MFWDIAANFYDIFEKYYNGEVNRKLALQVAEFIEKDDRVLECACGTGMITKAIAPKCRELIATDYSEGMLRQAKRNCASLPLTRQRLTPCPSFTAPGLMRLKSNVRPAAKA